MMRGVTMRKNSLVRVESDAVQGPGSFVTFRKPDWKAMRKAMKGTDLQGAEAEIGLAMMDELVPEMVVAWNWTDDEGKPLPVPSKDAEVFGSLTAEEVMFLINHATPLIKLDQGN